MVFPFVFEVQVPKGDHGDHLSTWAWASECLPESSLKIPKAERREQGLFSVVFSFRRRMRTETHEIDFVCVVFCGMHMFGWSLPAKIQHTCKVSLFMGFGFYEIGKW